MDFPPLYWVAGDPTRPERTALPADLFFPYRIVALTTPGPARNHPYFCFSLCLLSLDTSHSQGAAAGATFEAVGVSDQLPSKVGVVSGRMAAVFSTYQLWSQYTVILQLSAGTFGAVGGGH